jgi:hypothetical protein
MILMILTSFLLRYESNFRFNLNFFFNIIILLIFNRLTSFKKIYGIFQNPNTMDYILICKDEYDCKKCGEKYTNIYGKWCKPCLMSHLKNNFTNWTENKELIILFRKCNQKLIVIRII